MDKDAAILTAIIVIGCTAIGAAIAYAIATSETVSKCMIDGHYVGYVQCFTNWCRHWATDELKWLGGEEE